MATDYLSHKLRLTNFLGGRKLNGMDKSSSILRKRGRPLTGQMPKQYFRMAELEYAEVKEAARIKATKDDERENVSEFIRRTILDKARAILKRRNCTRGS